jgi:hypothetical protein
MTDPDRLPDLVEEAGLSFYMDGGGSHSGMVHGVAGHAPPPVRTRAPDDAVNGGVAESDRGAGGGGLVGQRGLSARSERHGSSASVCGLKQMIRPPQGLECACRHSSFTGRELQRTP